MSAGTLTSGRPPGLLEKLAANAGRDLDLIGVGEAMIELWTVGRLADSPSLQRAYGGDVLNSLVMAARLGARTGFISRVGDDPFGQALRQAWRSEGVDVARAALVPGVNGVYFISRGADGDREFSYRRSGSAAAGLSENDLDESYLARARVLLVSGVTQAISPSAQATALQAARLAQRHGAIVAYDPNYRPALWAARASAGAGSDVPPDNRASAEGTGAQPTLTAPAESAAAAFRELLPFVDLLLLSEPGDLPVLGQPTRPDFGASGEVGRASGLGLAHGTGWAYDYRFAGPAASGLAVGVKRGSEGGSLFLAGELYAAEAAPGTTVIDTTGAGDAWNAGLLHALTSGRPAAAAVRAANAVAAWKIARFGAVPRLDGSARRSLHDAYGA